MKTNFSVISIWKRAKASLQPKSRFYNDGKPYQLFHKGIRARFKPDGRIESMKTNHEFIKFGYTENGDRYVKEYKSEPIMFFRGKFNLLFKKYFLNK